MARVCENNAIFATEKYKMMSKSTMWTETTELHTSEKS